MFILNTFLIKRDRLGGEESYFFIPSPVIYYFVFSFSSQDDTRDFCLAMQSEVTGENWPSTLPRFDFLIHLIATSVTSCVPHRGLKPDKTLQLLSQALSPLPQLKAGGKQKQSGRPWVLNGSILPAEPSFNWERCMLGEQPI